MNYADNFSTEDLGNGFIKVTINHPYDTLLDTSFETHGMMNDAGWHKHFEKIS